jgi:type IV secretion system protein TrbF
MSEITHSAWSAADRSANLPRFLENVRAIPGDPVIVRQNCLAAYDFITDKGAVALNDYARTNDPSPRSGKFRSRLTFRA